MTQEKISLFFESLHEGTSVEAFGSIYDDEVTFTDPFNEVKGIDTLYEIFAHMYKNLHKPRFVITEYIGTKNTAYVKWDFIFSFKGEEGEKRFEGISRLEINAEDKVVSHIDYWDSAHIYDKLPLIGSLLRFIKRKIASS